MAKYIIWFDWFDVYRDTGIHGYSDKLILGYTKIQGFRDTGI